MRMRRGPSAFGVLAVAAVLVFVAVAPTGALAQEDPRDPGRVNKLISVLETPGTVAEGMAPGDSGALYISVTNPYENGMENISLETGIFMYATLKERRDVTSSWSSPSIGESGGVDYTFPTFNLTAGQQSNMSFTIVTAPDTPHGDVFTQSAYFIRFRMEFDYMNISGPEHLVMRSPGHFTSEQWAEAIREPSDSDEPYYRGEINLTYLQQVGGPLDGILPDTSFALKEPIPVWPFYFLAVVLVLSGLFAFLFYIEENPGTWPWLERRWLGFRGRFGQAVRLSRFGRARDKGPKVAGPGKGAEDGRISENQAAPKKDGPGDRAGEEAPEGSASPKEDGTGEKTNSMEEGSGEDSGPKEKDL